MAVDDTTVDAFEDPLRAVHNEGESEGKEGMTVAAPATRNAMQQTHIALVAVVSFSSVVHTTTTQRICTRELYFSSRSGYHKHARKRYRG